MPRMMTPAYRFILATLLVMTGSALLLQACGGGGGGGGGAAPAPGATLPQVWLSANNGATGSELYGSDGTAAGTTLIKNININASTGSSPDNLVVMNGTAYFTANDGLSGVELWKSDGTLGGTTLVKDINLGSASAFPSTFYTKALTVVGNTLYFAADDGSSGVELWKSDGTLAGTMRVKDFVAGLAGGGPSGLTAVGNTLYFTAYDATNGRELWKSDGTLAGTVLVRDIEPGPADSAPGFLTAIGTTIYFSACTTATGCELWKSDGTLAGTALFMDITPGADATSSAYHSFPQLLTAMGGTFYFTANDVPQNTVLIVTNGTQLWKSDGTVPGTVKLKSLVPPSGGTYPGNLAVVGTTLYFNASDAINGTELWKSDGTALGTVMVRNINPGTASSNVFGSSLTPVGIAVGNTLYFTATDGTNGYELWKSDGTIPGTVQVKNINPGAASSFPSFFTAVGSTLYFTANDGTNGIELWKSDGTDPGTVNVINLNPGTANGVIGILN